MSNGTKETVPFVVDPRTTTEVHPDVVAAYVNPGPGAAFWAQTGLAGGAPAPQPPVPEPPTPPVITDISPNSVGGGSWDTTVTINGSGFVDGAIPYYGDHLSFLDPMNSPAFISANQMTGVIPASALGAPKTYMVVVINPDQEQSADVPFTVT